MANFLISTPSSETTGTLTADLFSLTTANEVTVFGLDGADTFSSEATVGAVSAAKINAGKGADTITWSAGGNPFTQGSIFAGAGHDSLIVSAAVASSVVRAGQGNDTIDYAGVLTNSTVNGNDLADSITATILTASNTSLIAAGKGKDTINLFMSGSQELTVNGGAGHDSINFDGDGAIADTFISSFVAQGGAGNDTINFDATASINLTGDVLVDGGTQADRIVFSAEFGVNQSASILGGSGADTIIFSANVSANASIVDAGAGADSIFFGENSASYASTVNGGAGHDSITFSAGAIASAGAIVSANLGYAGGAGADVFSLGTATMAGASGAANAAAKTYYSATQGRIIRFNAFSESNLDNMDTVSSEIVFQSGTIDKSGGTVQANLFHVSQDSVSANLQDTKAGTFTSTNSIVTFSSNIADNLTARAIELDAKLGKGDVAYFEANNGADDYIFIQGGASNSGNGDDLLISISTALTVSSFSVGTNDSSVSVSIQTAFVS